MVRGRGDIHLVHKGNSHTHRIVVEHGCDIITQTTNDDDCDGDAGHPAELTMVSGSAPSGDLDTSSGLPIET